jgi:hypothetical protein
MVIMCDEQEVQSRIEFTVEWAEARRKWIAVDGVLGDVDSMKLRSSRASWLCSSLTTAYVPFFVSLVSSNKPRLRIFPTVAATAASKEDL